MSLLLIRHAHAGARKDWAGDDRYRPLSAKGVRQADALLANLAPWPVQRILSSPFRRCMQTMESLAAELGLTVESCPDLGEGHGIKALRLVRSMADDKVALCTHGDVIADVLVPIADEDRIDLGPRPRQAKGSVWILEATAGRFTKATYLGPR